MARGPWCSTVSGRPGARAPAGAASAGRGSGDAPAREVASWLRPAPELPAPGPGRSLGARRQRGRGRAEVRGVGVPGARPCVVARVAALRLPAPAPLLAPAGLEPPPCDPGWARSGLASCPAPLLRCRGVPASPGLPGVPAPASARAALRTGRGWHHRAPGWVGPGLARRRRPPRRAARERPGRRPTVAGGGRPLSGAAWGYASFEGPPGVPVTPDRGFRRRASGSRSPPRGSLHPAAHHATPTARRSSGPTA